MQRGEHCLLLVPSVLAPDEKNCLINPAHPEFKRMVIQESVEVAYDPRMFGKRVGGRDDDFARRLDVPIGFGGVAAAAESFRPVTVGS